MIFDTHSHYNLEPLAQDWQHQWQKAQEHGVGKSIVVGTALDTSELAVTLAGQNPAFKAAVAIHPSEYQMLIEAQGETEVPLLITTQINHLKKLAENNNVVAIGETGLDYFRLPEDEILVKQIKVAQNQAFSAHLKLAEDTNLPLIIHVRDKGEAAYQDVLTALKAPNTRTQPFILHCVSGPLDYIKEALELGAYLGIAGNVTYPSAEHIRDIIRMAPPDRLVLETDAPFLPPQEFRGKTCEPWMIDLTVEFVRDELNLDLEKLAQNASTVFGF